MSWVMVNQPCPFPFLTTSPPARSTPAASSLPTINHPLRLLQRHQFVLVAMHEQRRGRRRRDLLRRRQTAGEDRTFFRIRHRDEEHFLLVEFDEVEGRPVRRWHGVAAKRLVAGLPKVEVVRRGEEDGGGAARGSIRGSTGSLAIGLPGPPVVAIRRGQMAAGREAPMMPSLARGSMPWFSRAWCRTKRTARCTSSNISGTVNPRLAARTARCTSSNISGTVNRGSLPWTTAKTV